METGQTASPTRGVLRTAIRIALTAALVLILLMDRALADEDPDSLGPLDYIVISHSALPSGPGSALRQLLTLKKSQGICYRHFAIGNGVHRDSIRNIVRNLYDSTDYAPLYVLLVGSARRGGGVDAVSNSDRQNLIPTFYADDAFGHRTAYDQWYGYLEPGDDVRRIPRIIVGRIPARTDAELQGYVNKLSAYVSDTADAVWKRRAFLIAGDRYRGGFPDFTPPGVVNSGIDALYDSLPASMTGSILRYSLYSSDNDRRQMFRDAVNGGQGLIAYLSTYSSATALDGIITRPPFNAATDLTNSNMYPVFLAVSCNLGQVDVDTSLAENLLFAPASGAVGVVGPAGFSSDLSNTPFLEEIWDGLFKRGVRKLGNVTVAACLSLSARVEGVGDTYDMMTVLGDPGVDIDLGSAVDNQSGFYADMEQSSATPRQYEGDTLQCGVPYAKAGVIKQGQLRGRRSYRVEGCYRGAGNPTWHWTLYDDLGIDLNSTSRFLTYRLKVADHFNDSARFNVDLVVDLLPGTQVLLGEYWGAEVKDQYGMPLAVAARRVPIGSDMLYAFDLTPAFGNNVRAVVIGHDAQGVNFSGNFNSVFDDIALSATWGAPPDVGPIQMPGNMYKNATPNASICADDRDIMLDGDGLSVHWSATKGYFAPDTGFSVVYHAPDDTATGVVKAVVHDKGGHVDSSMKTIVIINHGSPTCPHLFVWDGRGYVDQGAVLTRSRFDSASVARDAHPVLTKPTAAGNVVRLALREEGNDVTRLEKIALTLVKVNGDPADRVGISTDGRVLKAVRPVLPVACTDEHGFDHLREVAARDGTRYSGFGPGYLVVGYTDLSGAGLRKIVDFSAESGGGPSLEDPPKNQYKIAVPSAEPTEPNYVSVSIFSPIQDEWDDEPDGNWADHVRWDEVARLAPSSGAGLPELVDLLPYVDARGELWIKISWTWSFSADDLCFYRFSDSGITQREVALSGARHSSSGSVVQSLLNEDGQKATLSPGQEIVLEFPFTRSDLYDFAIMRFWGRYDPVGRGGQEFSGPMSPVPSDVRLAQNFPNPFNAGTVITYDLPEDGHVTLEVFDILGRRVATLVDDDGVAGRHTVAWDGRDDRGHAVASGVYFYCLSAQGISQSKKMILLK